MTKIEEEKIEVKVTVNCIERVYVGTYDELHNNDWNEIIRLELDNYQ